MKEVSAVEWLVEQLPLIQQEGLRYVIEDAIYMEKEQIKNAWLNSLTKGDYNSAEEYYNETFKQ
jgi:hypothetical protein